MHCRLRKRLRPYRYCGAALFLLSVCVIQGCATLKRPGPPSPPELTGEEEAFAEALAHYCRGLICETEFGRDSPLAREHFRKASELDPKRHRLYAKLAMAALLGGERDLAIEALQRSCRENPGSLQARVDLATAYQITGNTAMAVENFRKALEIDPATTSVYMALANLLFFKDDPEQALEILGEGIRNVPNAEPLLVFTYSQGVGFIESGDVENAIGCLNLVAEHTTVQRAQLHHLLGELHEGAGRPQDAIASFSLATAQPEPLPQSFLKLALLYAEHEPARAIETLLRADDLLPDNVLILLSLAQIYAYEDKLDEAIGIYERVKEAEAQTPEHELTSGFYLRYGAICDQAGMPERAEQIFQQCLEEFDDAHAVMNYLAYMWAEKDVHLDEALAHITRALEFEPENGAYIDTLGWVLYKKGLYREALEQIAKAHEILGDDPTIVDHLGDIWNALGETEKAVDSWSESFVLDPGNESVLEKLGEHGIDPAPLREEVENRRREREAAEHAEPTADPEQAEP